MRSATGVSPLLAATVAGPAGPIHIGVSELGVVAVSVSATAADFEAGIHRRLRVEVRWVDGGNGAGSTLLEAASRAVEAMAAGDPDAQARIDVLPIDLSDRPAWDQAVLGAVRGIPRGEVRSYGQIARAVDRPGAARAVGGAVGRNPVALVIPCHRVVAGDGTLGGYGGGWGGDRERLLDLKSELLAGEGVSLPKSRPSARHGR